MHSEILLEWIKADKDLMKLLHIIQDLHLPNSFLAAGVIRNFVWDRLHEKSSRTPLNDVDVVYFNNVENSEIMDKTIERRLNKTAPDICWQVRNQARMHLRNGHPPYKSVEDAMKYWPETATAVGVCLDDDGNWRIAAPYGLGDLFNLILRKSPHCSHKELFYERIQQKQWLRLWPKLKIIEED